MLKHVHTIVIDNGCSKMSAKSNHNKKCKGLFVLDWVVVDTNLLNVCKSNKMLSSTLLHEQSTFFTVSTLKNMHNFIIV